MGGRGQSAIKSSFATIRNGYITQYRNIKPSDRLLDSGKGLMYREYGTKQWLYTRETRADVAKNNKLHPLNAKAVNPKNYVNSQQRYKNERLKENIKNKRAGNKPQQFSDGKVTGYKNGKRQIDKAYKREEQKNALSRKKEELSRLKFTSGTFKATASEKRAMNKLERAITKLRNEINQ